MCMSECGCLCVIEGTEGGVGGSVSQVHAGAKQGHQLFLIVSDVPLHDLLTGAQEALKCLHIYYCRKREERDVRRVSALQIHLSCSVTCHSKLNSSVMSDKWLQIMQFLKCFVLMFQTWTRLLVETLGSETKEQRWYSTVIWTQQVKEVSTGKNTVMKIWIKLFWYENCAQLLIYD